MKLLGLSRAKNMAKIDKIDTGEINVWYFLSPNVQKFIEKIPVNSEVEFEVEDKPGKGKIITFIKVKGDKISTPIKEEKKTPDFVCAKCGKAMKDDKYDMCYDCNQAERAKEKTSTITTTNKYGKSPEEQNSIMRQAVGHVVSRSLISMQGTVDINNIESIVDTLYDLYLKKVKG